MGPCGAGKSTVATRLAARIGVEATHLDEIHWKPGWVEAAPEEERAVLAARLAASAWVVDGNYGRLRREHLDAVELFVWLDLPLRVTLPRLVRRGLVRSLWRVPCCNGNTESLRRTFFDRESLLLWAVQTDARRRAELARELARRPHVRLRTGRAIRRWLDDAARPAPLSAAAPPSRS